MTTTDNDNEAPLITRHTPLADYAAAIEASRTTGRMLRVCAWCVPRKPPTEVVVTHGLCDECLEDMWP